MMAPTRPMEKRAAESAKTASVGIMTDLFVG
jgi:hypothetical protein